MYSIEINKFKHPEGKEYDAILVAYHNGAGQRYKKQLLIKRWGAKGTLGQFKAEVLPKGTTGARKAISALKKTREKRGYHFKGSSTAVGIACSEVLVDLLGESMTSLALRRKLGEIISNFEFGPELENVLMQAGSPEENLEDVDFGEPEPERGEGWGSW